MKRNVRGLSSVYGLNSTWRTMEGSQPSTRQACKDDLFRRKLACGYYIYRRILRWEETSFCGDAQGAPLSLLFWLRLEARPRELTNRACGLWNGIETRASLLVVSFTGEEIFVAMLSVLQEVVREDAYCLHVHVAWWNRALTFCTTLATVVAESHYAS
jgi:hypothetical protein